MLAQSGTAVTGSRDVFIALLLLLPFVAISLLAYARWLRALRARGGRVTGAHFHWPDLAVTIFLGFGLSLLSLKLFTQPENLAEQLSTRQLLSASFIYVVFLAFFLAFLGFRKVSFAEIFGLRILSAWRVLGQAALFLLAAISPIVLMGLLMTGLGGFNKEQAIVQFFRKQAESGDFGGVVAVFVSAVILAPIWEELVFRGYFYPTLKRRLGPVVSALLVSALFAAIHGNVISLPMLFVLALALTVAYEWTGSILVSITMHGLFNCLSLVLMFLEMTRRAP